MISQQKFTEHGTFFVNSVVTLKVNTPSHFRAFGLSDSIQFTFSTDEAPDLSLVTFEGLPRYLTSDAPLECTLSEFNTLTSLWPAPEV